MKFKLHFDLFNIIIIIVLIYILYRLPSVEKMSNIDKATEDKIREIYKIDTDAIRNLSNLAKDLTVNGTLTVPGGLKIKGNLKVEGNSETKHLIIDRGGEEWGGGMTVYGSKKEPFFINYFTNDNRNTRKGFVMFGEGNTSNVLFSGDTKHNNLTVNNNAEIKKQTTIHELYGGKSIFDGWRNIQVNGGHLMFNVGNKGFGFHSNDNALHYYVDKVSKPLNIYGGINTNGNLTVSGTGSFSNNDVIIRTAGWPNQWIQGGNILLRADVPKLGKQTGLQLGAYYHNRHGSMWRYNHNGTYHQEVKW
jgi:hypothetical protein